MTIELDFEQLIREAQNHAGQFGVKLALARIASAQKNTLKAKKLKDSAVRHLKRAEKAVTRADIVSRTMSQRVVVDRFLDGLDFMRTKMIRVTAKLF